MSAPPSSTIQWWRHLSNFQESVLLLCGCTWASKASCISSLAFFREACGSLSHFLPKLIGSWLFVESSRQAKTKKKVFRFRSGQMGVHISQQIFIFFLPENTTNMLKRNTIVSKLLFSTSKNLKPFPWKATPQVLRIECLNGLTAVRAYGPFLLNNCK